MHKEKELELAREELRKAHEESERQVSELNNELRERLTPAEMERIKSILVTLQVLFAPVYDV